jgi:hypothetical protein
MAYWTYFSGELEIQLSEPYVEVIKAHIENVFASQRQFKITQSHLEVGDEWKNGYGFFEDILLFIAQNGKLISGEIYVSGEERDDKKILVIENGELRYKEFSYREDKKEQIQFKTFVDLIEEEGRGTYFQSCENTSDELEEAISELSDEFPDNLEELLQKIVDVKETVSGSIVEGFQEEGKLRIDKNGDYYFIPCVEDEQSSSLYKVPMFPMPNLLSQHTYDPNDPRKISIGEIRVSAYEPLMKLDQGCDFCIHRLTSLTGKCQPCQPKLISLKEMQTS